MQTKKLMKKKEQIVNKNLYLVSTLFGIFITIVIVGYVFRNLFVYPVAEVYQLTPQKFIEEERQVISLPLNKPEVVTHGSRRIHAIALTFDADMTYAMKSMLEKKKVTSWYNKRIKKILDKNNVKATIFLTGLWTELYPKDAKELAQDPLFEIGNHSYSHPAFTSHCFKLPFIDNSKKRDQVASAQEVINRITGVTPKYFRFPGGCYKQIDLQTVASLGLTVVHWDVAADDGFNNNTNSIVARVKKGIQNGSIVVFHLHGGPYAPKTADALEILIPYLKKQGYTFVTITELLSEK